MGRKGKAMTYNTILKSESESSHIMTYIQTSDGRMYYVSTSKNVLTGGKWETMVFPINGRYKEIIWDEVAAFTHDGSTAALSKHYEICVTFGA